jgi:lipid-binding SYLF domain-containing protein
MRLVTNTLLVALFCGMLMAGCQSKPKTEGDRSEMQGDTRNTVSNTLTRLYEVQPKAKTAVSQAVGYAVFNNFGMKLGVAGGGSGKGIAINNKTKAETFMRMAEVQAGLGLGVKKFSLVWVFETQEAFDNFINKGWEFGAQANASAQAGDQGGSLAGALAVAPGVWLYQITDTGLALELTAKGTKYYKDTALN